MARLGMDVDAVENIGRGLQADADTLTSLIGRTHTLVRQLPAVWDGRDATTFVENWWPKHKSTLETIQVAIHGLGQSALNNAAEQRQISGDASGGGGASTLAGSSTSGAGSSAAQAPAVTTSSNADYLPSAGGADRYRAAIETPGSFWAGLTGGGYAYQCVSWAKFRRDEFGLPYYQANGGQQASVTADRQGGLIAGAAATPGSLVSSPSEGHVMVVEQKLSDAPPTFRISEMNVGNPSIPDANGQDANQGTYEEFRDDSVATQQPDGTWKISRTNQYGVRYEQVYRDLEFCKGTAE